MTGRENLEFTARLFGLGRRTAMSFITDPDQLQQLDLTILDEADRSRPAGA
jgi:hypothetical protein